MTLRNTINRFYYDMTVSDLRRLHSSSGHELSYYSVMYLDLIGYQSHQEGGCTVSGLARTLGISKPAVTKKVNELEQQGLVVRVRDEKDKRVFHLRMSDREEACAADFDRPLERAVQRVKREFGEREIQDFCNILQVFSDEFKFGD